MNAQLMQVVSESLPASHKVYRPGTLHAGLRVPMREIVLHPSSGEPPVVVYDPSGPFTDPEQKLDRFLQVRRVHRINERLRRGRRCSRWRS